MKLNNILKWLCKSIISGVFAFCILTFVCIFYYNIPVHFANETGSTDYRWKPNTFYSRLTEGLAFGKTNNEGFNNSYDYNDDTKISFLIMGSSHMEAYQVFQSQTLTELINKFGGGEKTCL